MDLAALNKIITEHLVLESAVPLGIAQPPYAAGVYALFYNNDRVYVGVARGKKGLRNRKRNYVGGDEGHTTHRQFLGTYPFKPERTAYIKKNVSMVWFETGDAELAVSLEKQLISTLQPPWNRIGIREP